MRKTFFIYFIITQLLFDGIAYSQTGFRIGNELLAPPTDTWNFIKYGEVGANLYTGTVNISIPFYKYQDNDFEIPITLTYASNGLVANSRAGILGTDWVLDAGGSIAVDVRGIPDDNSMRDVPGFYHYHKSGNALNINNLWRFYNPSSGYGMPAPIMLYSVGGKINSPAPKYDAEPDIFHFNFMGYSGTFHLGVDNKIHVYNTNNNKGYKIEIQAAGLGFNQISITTSDGYKYLFKHMGLGYNIDKVELMAFHNPQTLSWKLSNIIAPNGRTVTFNYEQYEIEYFRPASFCDYGQYINESPYEDVFIKTPIWLAQKFVGITCFIFVSRKYEERSNFVVSKRVQ